MRLLLICPSCRNKMQYQNRTEGVIGKKKTCVFCGTQFTISRQTIERNLEKR